LVSLGATRAGPVCLIEFPEQFYEPLREPTLWRKSIPQRFTQLGMNKPMIITVPPVLRFFVFRIVFRHGITLP
jgi:hypothetical protein